MAEFAGDSQSYKPFTFLDIDTNIELTNQFPELNPNGFSNPNMNLQSFIFSNDNFLLQQQPEFEMQFADNLPNLYHSNASNAVPIVQSMPSPEDVVHERKKQKTMEVSESSSKNSSSPVSGNGSKEDNKRKNSLGRGKRSRSDEKKVEKSKEEVIHVRARRGQATDSHSLAERVRREKINERLRCLQDLVPGCYKTMGMAVMLDEIINYVQSLQNQVEFLSMKLSTASSAYEHNPEIEVMATMQGTNAHEAQEVERLMREGYGGFSYFHSTWPL